MKLIQILKEIKVNSPLMEFNVDLKEDEEVDYFVWAIQNGDDYYGMDEQWNPIAFNLTVGPVKHNFGLIIVKETYKVIFHLAIGMGYMTHQQADTLEEMAKKSRVPYERDTSPSGADYIKFFLDKNLINTSLYINNTPFRNLASKAQ